MAVDMLSTSLDDDDAFADLVDATSVADLLAGPGCLAVAVGLDHPHNPQVLRLLIDHLQDRTLASRGGSCPRTGLGETPKTRPSALPLPGP
jgi:hypothetical protein